MRQAALERSPLVARALAAARPGGPARRARRDRSRGTVGGSVAHADPNAELPVALAALDARFHVRSARGERVIEELFTGPLETALEPGELLTAIEVPPLPPRAPHGVRRVRAARTAASPTPASPSSARPGTQRSRCSAPARVPIRAAKAEEALREGAAREAAELAARRIDDPHRRALVAALAREAIARREGHGAHQRRPARRRGRAAHARSRDFIRDAGLTGTKVGCEHGVCGACTVQLDGEPVRSCLMLAVQADGSDVRTIEGLDDEPHPLQAAFHEHHALQCGFCTAGILMTLDAYLREHPEPTEARDRARRSPATSAAARAIGHGRACRR